MEKCDWLETWHQEGQWMLGPGPDSLGNWEMWWYRGTVIPSASTEQLLFEGWVLAPSYVTEVNAVLDAFFDWWFTVK